MTPDDHQELARLLAEHCPHKVGDEGGNPYCSEIVRLERELAAMKAERDAALKELNWVKDVLAQECGYSGRLWVRMRRWVAGGMLHDSPGAVKPRSFSGRADNG